MEEKILFLTIKRFWFDKILSGEKTIEYREFKKYYINKFKNNYTHLILQAGYSKTSPRLKAKILKIEIKEINIQDIDNSLFVDKKKYYLIHLNSISLQ